MLGCWGAVLIAGCSTPAPASAEAAAQPKDAQHAGITTPHRDHSAHHGGMVLMNGDLQPLSLGIDDSGESWVAAGRPVDPGGVTMKVSYLLREQPFAIEIPFAVFLS